MAKQKLVDVIGKGLRDARQATALGSQLQPGDIPLSAAVGTAEERISNYTLAMLGALEVAVVRLANEIDKLRAEKQAKA